MFSDQPLHLPDWSKLELPPHQREIQADLKIGSSLTLPLRRDGECIGVIGVGRTQAQAFAPREIALLESFADQVREYIDQQGPAFRLNFFVDEVGQFIGQDSKLMLNLQTIAESLATAAIYGDSVPVSSLKSYFAIRWVPAARWKRG